MKTPTAWRVTCDACEKDCTESHVMITDSTPGAMVLRMFNGDAATEYHYCSADCLVGNIAEKVNA